MIWKSVKLKDLCKDSKADIVDGPFGSNLKSEHFQNEGKPVLKIQNIKEFHILKKKPSFVSESTFNALARHSFKKNDLVMTKLGQPLGVTALVRDFDEGIIVADLVRIRPDKSIVDLRYLEFLLNSPNVRSQINKEAKGATRPRINLSIVRNLDLIIPPLKEQQRIVAKLDAAFAEIDGAISVTQSQINQGHILFENIIAEQFSYKEGYSRKTLQDICEKITDGTHQTPKYYDEGYIFLSSKNVTSRKIDWKNVKYVDESQHVEMQKRLSPKVGDILLAKNGTTGVAAMVDKDVIFNIYVSLAWLRSKGDVTPEYLLNFVNSKVARQQFSKRTKGIGVPNLHLKEIREVEISFPNGLSQQQEIVYQVSNIDEAYLKYCETLADKLGNLKALKLAILAQELQGEAA